MAQGSASASALIDPLTEDALFAECLSGTDAALGHKEAIASAATPAPCIAHPTGANHPLPAVLLGRHDCIEAGYLEPGPDLLFDLNHRRQLEIAIVDVPGQCPTALEANEWVSAQLDDISEPIEVINVPGGAGEQCYIPDVDWQCATIRISPRGDGASKLVTGPLMRRPGCSYDCLATECRCRSRRPGPERHPDRR